MEKEIGKEKERVKREATKTGERRTEGREKG